MEKSQAFHCWMKVIVEWDKMIQLDVYIENVGGSSEFSFYLHNCVFNDIAYSSISNAVVIVYSFRLLQK